MMMTTPPAKDEWVRAAMTDDSMVVELLVRLKQAQAAASAPKSAVSALKWGIRQPRSRPMLMRCDDKRDGDFDVGTRCSPTTPLSWSGGGAAASPSTADGFEETSTDVIGSPPAAPSRSKVYFLLSLSSDLFFCFVVLSFGMSKLRVTHPFFRTF